MYIYDTMTVTTTMQVPAGTYYVGDPVHFLKEIHLEEWNYEYGIHFDNKMFVYNTIGLEGYYSDSDATMYLVKTGTFGLIDISLCDTSVNVSDDGMPLDGSTTFKVIDLNLCLGRIIDSNGQPITFTETHDGILTISYGDIVIDLNTSFSDDLFF